MGADLGAHTSDFDGTGGVGKPLKRATRRRAQKKKKFPNGAGASILPCFPPWVGAKGERASILGGGGGRGRVGKLLVSRLTLCIRMWRGRARRHHHAVAMPREWHPLPKNAQVKHAQVWEACARGENLWKYIIYLLQHIACKGARGTRVVSVWHKCGGVDWVDLEW